jgi:dihydroorotase
MTSQIASDGVLITGARIIDPVSKLDRVGDVVVADGLVRSIATSKSERKQISPGDVAMVIDGEGLIACPGLIDPHVHLREPGFEYKETIQSGARAAAAGGFTAVCCMPNTSPALDSPELVRFVKDRSEGAACRVFAVAAATKGRKGEELTESRLLAMAGAVGLSDDGDCIASAGMMGRVLSACKDVGLAFMQHAQEPTMTKGASMHAGSVSTRLGLVGWPRAAEEIIVERDVRLNAGIGAHYHVQHISSAGTCDILRRARRDGIRVTGEASPHHLVATHDLCQGYNANAKVNPPLREMSDVKALRQAVADGVVTVLGTDHAPHSADEKALPFEEAPFGFVGLESALGLYVEGLIASGAVAWPRLIALLTIEPARLCGLDRIGLGRLVVGGPADLTLIDPQERWTLVKDELAGQSSNTPFLGRALTGRAVLSMVAGRVQHQRLGERLGSSGPVFQA